MSDLIKAGGNNYILKSTNMSVLFVIRKNCHISRKTLLLHLLIRSLHLTAIITEEQLFLRCIRISPACSSQGQLCAQKKLPGSIMGSDVIRQILIRHRAFAAY
jgi:hypothetical protein